MPDSHKQMLPTLNSGLYMSHTQEIEKGHRKEKAEKVQKVTKFVNKTPVNKFLATII